MPRYADPNMILAQQLGSEVARLFAPQNNTQAMKYMLGASQIGENRANIGKLDSETGLNTQTYGNRALATPETVAAALQLEQSPQGQALAQLFAGALGQGGNAEQAIGGLNAAMGGNMMRGATDEGGMRRGYALTGHDASVNNPLTAGGIADLFGQQTNLNDADNATSRANAGTAAAASRYGADRRFDASIYDTDHKLFNVGKDSTLVDRHGNPMARGAGVGAQGAGGAAIKPSDSATLAKEIVSALPAGATLDGRDIAQATALAAQRMAQNGGNAAAAISDVVRLFAVTPGVPNAEDPSKFDVAPTATATQSIRAGVVPQIIEANNPAAMAATPPANLPPGARLAPDGNYYVQLPNGKYARVEF